TAPGDGQILSTVDVGDGILAGPRDGIRRNGQGGSESFDIGAALAVVHRIIAWRQILGGRRNERRKATADRATLHFVLIREASAVEPGELFHAGRPGDVDRRAGIQKLEGGIFTDRKVSGTWEEVTEESAIGLKWVDDAAGRRNWNIDAGAAHDGAN